MRRSFRAGRLEVSLASISGTYFLKESFRFRSLNGPPYSDLRNFLHILAVSTRSARIVHVTRSRRFLRIYLPRFLMTFAFIGSLQDASSSVHTMAIYCKVFCPLTVRPIIGFIRRRIYRRQKSGPALQYSFY